MMKTQQTVMLCLRSHLFFTLCGLESRAFTSPVCRWCFGWLVSTIRAFYTQSCLLFRLRSISSNRSSSSKAVAGVLLFFFMFFPFDNAGKIDLVDRFLLLGLFFF